VDDGEIDPVGECNLDAWHQRERHHGNRYQSVLSPACTFSALPSVQLGAALVREGDAGDRHSRLSPELKTPLLARDAGWGERPPGVLAERADSGGFFRRGGGGRGGGTGGA
ncbi:hypothetical protein Q2470_29455, partial [Pseudomonas aeruginosa]|nr:hypothetical protein [Pseudomonas aeruginosa]